MFEEPHKRTPVYQGPNMFFIQIDWFSAQSSITVHHTNTRTKFRIKKCTLPSNDRNKKRKTKLERNILLQAVGIFQRDRHCFILYNSMCDLASNKAIIKFFSFKIQIRFVPTGVWYRNS